MSGRGGDARLAPLALVHITPGYGDPRGIEELVLRSVDGGVRAVQLREPRLTVRELARLCERLRPRLAAVGGLLLVNDRADVAAAGLADGVHLGHRSLRPEQVRSFLGDGLIGCSVHDADELEAAARSGADYVFLSPVHPTRSKPLAAPLGVAVAERWTAAAGMPVVWLGGFDAERISAARGAGVSAAGFAVLGELADAATIGAQARALAAAAGVAGGEVE